MQRFSTQNHLKFGLSQQILLDDHGHMVISCDSIFSSLSFRNISFLSISPFVESIFPVLRDLKVNDPALHFPKVETELDFLPGTYDYYFSRIDLEEGSYILWSIYDYTKVYEDFRRFQQRKNELQVHRQLLAFRLQEMKRQEDLIQLNRAFEEGATPSVAHLNHLESTLRAPFNILDGFNWMITQPRGLADQYLSALEDSMQQLLQAVINIRHYTHPISWDELWNTITQTEKNRNKVLLTIPDEVRNITSGQVPYLGLMLRNIVDAFRAKYLQVQLYTSLRTDIEAFEKGALQLDVKVEDLEKKGQDLLSQRDTILRLYLLRSLVHEAGGLLQLHEGDGSTQLGFSIQMPVILPTNS